MFTYSKHYINGQFVESHGQELFDLINPTNGELRGRVKLGDEVDVELAIRSAKQAFKTFSKTTLQERAELLDRLAHAFASRSEEHKKAIIEEYGGTTQMAEFSVDRVVKYFGTIKEAMLQTEFSKKINKAIVLKESIGVAGLITPWNSSSAFIATKFAVAIAAGCPVVVKPSEMSATQTQLLLECFHEARIPKGVFNLVNGRGDVAGAAIVRSKDVAKISFTGSTAVGKWIAREGTETLKRVTLELGGKSPNILLDDADLKAAIPFALGSAFMNNGQACIAGTRLLVPEKMINDVKKEIEASISLFKVGDTHDPSVVIGPLVNKRQWDRVQSYIQKGIEEGAEVFLGGPGKPAGLEKGNFIKPTVFVNVKNNMAIARDEIFGPVLSVITYKTEDEAIQIANDTTYGLAGYLCTTNKARAMEFAEKIEAGRITINAFLDEPLAPFGGYKQSGLGRENGVMGIESFLETKTIYPEGF